MGSVIQRATGAFAPCQWGPRQLNGCSPDRPNADTAAASGAAYEKSFRIRDEGFHVEYDSLWPMYNECLRHLIEAGRHTGKTRDSNPAEALPTARMIAAIQVERRG